MLCQETTSSEIHLEWRTPHHNGGLPILGYEILYQVVERVGVSGVGAGDAGGVETVAHVKRIPVCEQYVLCVWLFWGSLVVGV